jgi:hypothetical protein
MKYKHYLYKSGLLISLLLSSLASYAQDFKVEFDEVNGRGVSANQVLINRVRVRLYAPFEPDGFIVHYDIHFKACQYDYDRQYLVPILGQEINCLVSQRNFSQSEISSVGVDRVLIKLNRSDPNTHIVFRFHPQTLELVSIVPTPPHQIRISLNWGEEPYDLDAHLTGPAPGTDASYNNEQDRFHVYFSNQNNEVSILYTSVFSDEQPEDVVIFPPADQQTLRPGIYRFTVHHFAGGGNIAQSDAQVYLWIGNEPAQLFTPPTVANYLRDESMESWGVFELHVADDGMVAVVPIQSYESQVNPSEVR